MATAKRENHMSKDVHATVRGGDRPLFPHAVSIEGQRMIFVSGQLAWDAQGHMVGEGDMAAQYVQIGKNIKAVLAQAGAGLEDVVKINTYVTDMAAYKDCMAAREEYFGPGWPTSTTVEISRLAHPGMLIEIDAIAVV